MNMSCLFALYPLEGYCLTSPAPLRAEVPATACVFPIVETAKEILTSVEQLQQCYTSTVEPQVSLSAALCAWEEKVSTDDKWSSDGVAHLLQDVRSKDHFGAVTVLDKVAADVLGVLAPQVEGPDWKRRKICARRQTGLNDQNSFWTCSQQCP